MLEHAKLSSIVKQVFTLDPTFGVKDLDGFKLPRRMSVWIWSLSSWPNFQE